MKYEISAFTFTSDKAAMDLDVIHNYLARSYWSEGISKDIIKRAIDNSLCFGIFDDQGQQVGFARVISDFATYAYLSDVFILENYRHNGLSKQFVNYIMSHPDLQGLRRFTLVTKDAHTLYEKYGFRALKNPERYMEIHRPGLYKTKV